MHTLKLFRFVCLVQYKATLFFEEISSIIVTPFILIFAFPKVSP